MIKYSSLLFSLVFVLLLLIPTLIPAANKVVVVPLGGAIGNATVADVVKDKTFSSNAGKGLTGTLERHPMGDVFIQSVLLLIFNRIPAGTFTMGSPADEPGRWPDESPQVITTISRPFYMMVNEVTQLQWAAVVDVGELFGLLAPGELNRAPSTYKGSGKPVTDVGFPDVVKWIEVLNILDYRTNCNGKLHDNCYRLPTEAEWEYAARAGATKAYANHYNFDDNNNETGNGFNSNLAAMGWYIWNDDNQGYTTGPKPVMRKQPNAWGLYDMHGNIWEWCRDWYDVFFYGKDPPERPEVDPEATILGQARVVRGGSYGEPANQARSARRYRELPLTRDAAVGFRIVLYSNQ